MNILSTLATLTQAVVTKTTTQDVHTCDLVASIQAAQALSSMIELPELIQELCRILLQNSGAEICVPILRSYIMPVEVGTESESSDLWQVYNISATSTSESGYLDSSPLSAYHQLPHKLINQVRNQCETFILDRQTTDFALLADPYLQKFQPASVMVLPLLLRGELRGIIYLENRITADVFNSDRRIILEFLAAQAVTSLHNAQMFESRKNTFQERQRQENALMAIVEGTAGKTGADFYQTCTKCLAEIFGVQYAFLTKLLDGDFKQSQMIALWTGIDFFAPYDMDLAGTPCLSTYQNSWGIFPHSLQAQFPTASALASLRGESYMSVVIKDFDGNILGNLGIIDTKPLPQDTSTLKFILQLFANRVAAEMKRQADEDRLQEANERLESTVQELLKATRLKDEFLATMSHELRTPLNAILGMSEALQDEIFGAVNDRQCKSLRTIERSGRHLLSLITDILDVSKISAGKLELDITPVSVFQLCHSSLAFVKQQAYEKEIQLHVDLPSKIGNITVDERRMRQVLINLLSNAVKFTPPGGQVSLRVISFDGQDSGNASRRLEFIVADTGIGIASVDCAKLFQPFVQLDSSLNRQYEGTGLGLTLVKQIVELHGGQINLQSELGKGSVFTVCLPPTCLCADDNSGLLLPFDSFSSYDGEAERDESRSDLILLAEDNAANVNTMFSYLTAKGYRLLLAENGREAIEIAQRERPNLILMDIQMPEMDGLEAITLLRNNPEFRETPIIALTALAMEGDRESCLAAGACDYLAKPIRLKQLNQTIQRWLNPK